MDAAGIERAMDASMRAHGAAITAWLLGYDGHRAFAECYQREQYSVELDPGCLDGPRAPWESGGDEARDEDEHEDWD